jgi:HEAT repeats/Putative zinc-finger
MTCQRVQESLSLYLYGEMEFSAEEEFEQHTAKCALCADALSRERKWHAVMNDAQASVPLDLLSQCRRELARELQAESRNAPSPWARLVESIRPTRWSMQLASAALLVCFGFSAALMLQRWQGPSSVASSEVTSKVRSIGRASNGEVDIAVDEVRPRRIHGSADDPSVVRYLIDASRDADDPSLRAESVDWLNKSAGTEVRDALLYSLGHDPNSGIRSKALEGLGRFSNDQIARNSLMAVVDHDQDPAIRGQAIDILVPGHSPILPNPQIAGKLQEVMASEQDGYVRQRAKQALQVMNASYETY